MSIAAYGAGSYFELLGGEPLSASMLSVVCDMQPHASLPVSATGGRPEGLMGMSKIQMVVIVVGFHLFPFRTEKLSPLTPMVLQCNAGE